MSASATPLRSRISSLGEVAAEKARLTVVPVVRSRAPRVPFVMLVSVVALAGVICLLMFNTSLQQASFTESSLEERAAVMADREETLRMQLDNLRDPQRVAQEAERMGMVIPAAPLFLRLDGTVIGEPRAALPEDALRITPRPREVPAELRRQVNVVEVPGDTPSPARRRR